MAQIQMHNDELPAAIHTLDMLIQPPNPQRSVEATVMLASLCMHPRPEVLSSDAAQEKVCARELFDQAIINKMLEHNNTHPNGNTNISTCAAAVTADDLEMHLDIAHLWQEEQPEQTVHAFHKALQISEASGQIDPWLLNNLVPLQHMDSHLDMAQSMYKAVLTKATSIGGSSGEAISTLILYNLARLFKDKEDLVMAKEAYDKLLTHHPEYVDARIQQARMLANLNQVNDAHEILKHALMAHTSNLNLCAYYTSFLIQNNQLKVTKDFVHTTLKDHEHSDVYSLCAAALIMYKQSCESRDSNPKALEECKHSFQHAGLVIATAEDALGALSSVTVASIMEETQLQIKNACDALDVFAKIWESLNDGCVYINIGHCYYTRDEFDCAIESYETASTRYYYCHNTSVLLYLCRLWYAKASKEQSFPAMNVALKYAQMALHLQPSDKVTMYNITMIQQKATELLLELPPSKHSLRDLEVAIRQATHA
ncbi:hypothetical protein EDD16DRAFT_1740946 [Pisolithus croceorrhizus]|nr:hypothetical protein EV401DRAFT_2121395 [Pisolithus croceorrhizus]KAI6107193.1 hypothetical protein EDD16DRAFT_1740946 [Pisolithus croceorrhizus]KAI6143156.1 hypothetical protein EDD17DRAFT_1768906 [Pisolithus thermaeus]